jgi:Ca2+-binding RTX toxin-like protein
MAENGTVYLQGDDASMDADGTDIDVQGSILAPEIVISGNAEDDWIQIQPASAADTIIGHTTVTGGTGDDRLTVSGLNSRTATLDLDGGQGTDLYTVDTTNQTDYVINVADTGAPDDGADRLTVNGTAEDDVFLVRRNFVAHLQEDGDVGYRDTFERINYNENINARLRLNGLEGDDAFYSDDNSSIMTLDGGSGNDSFQIGQMFGADRQSPYVAGGDEVDTVETTMGYLSSGISFPTTILGGDGEDTFTVYSNKAPLKLFGEDGNDEFIIRAFVIAGTDSLSSTDTLVSGGSGDDYIQYNINAPVNIDGGAGTDTVVIIGTEVDDNFVITEDGVQGAGLNIAFTAVEKLEVDGMEGDDHFFVLGTNPNLVTTIIGGLGSDTFDVGGDVTAEIVALSIEGRSAFINHSLESDDPVFNGVFAEGVALNVASGKTGTVMVAEDGGQTVLVEDSGLTDQYTVKLAAAAPSSPTVAFVTVSAALAGFKDEQNGGRTVEVSMDGVNYFSSLVLTFDSENTGAEAWDRTRAIYVRAASDTAEEGARTVVISHSIRSDNADFNHLDIPNVEVTVIDDDKAGLIVAETGIGSEVVEGSDVDTYGVTLTKAPDAGETVVVTLDYDNGRIAVGSLDPRYDAAGRTVTFDAGNWDQTITLTLAAVDDGDVENRMLATITHTVTSDGAVYGNVYEQPEVEVSVQDNDSGGLVVTQTDGATLVSENQPDAYTLKLTKAPTAPVTVSILSDGQTLVSSADSRFSSTNGATVTFDADNWDVPVVIDVTVNPFADVSDSPVQKYPAQPHMAGEIRGPLVIEGSMIPGQDRTLKTAVMLPAEADVALPVLDIDIDESQQTDTLNVFNDGSVASDAGGHDYVDHVSGIAAIYGVSEEAIDPTAFGNVSGLGMGGDLTLNFGTDAQPDDRIFDGGITYHGVEVVDILLGQGDDAFTVDHTIDGAMTVVQGGGGDDTITVNGGGGDASPLIVFGDSSQDGLFYTSTTADITGGARSFADPGDDTIDARNAGSGIVIYGGAGDDTLYGSQGGDHIAGGAGNDTIYGEGGTDHIYGDAGFNVDISRRLDHSTQVLTVVQTAGAGDHPATGDDLSTGADTLFGGIGDDVIFGDYGEVVQTAGTNRILTTGAIERIQTVNETAGSIDTIAGDEGDDRIFGGNGADTMSGGDGDDLMLGDHGILDYNTGDDDLATLDLMEARNTTDGAGDTLLGNAGDDTLMGGMGDDRLDGGNGSGNSPVFGSDQDTLIGDYGRVLFTGGVITRIETTQIAHGGNDSIDGNEDDDLIFGGFGSDVLNGNAGDDTIFGDNGNVVYTEGTPTLMETTDTSEATGGPDEIDAGDGDNIVFAGVGEDFVRAGSGNDFILGDNGVVAFDDNGLLENMRSLDTDLGGDDILYGGDGDNVIIGNTGDDEIHAGSGWDVLFGDGGMVTYKDGSRLALETVDHFTGGADILYSGSGNDIMFGGFGSDWFDGDLSKDIMVGEYGRVKYDNNQIEYLIRLAQTGIGFIGGVNFGIYRSQSVDTMFAEKGAVLTLTDGSVTTETGVQKPAHSARLSHAGMVAAINPDALEAYEGQGDIDELEKNGELEVPEVLENKDNMPENTEDIPKEKQELPGMEKVPGEKTAAIEAAVERAETVNSFAAGFAGWGMATALGRKKKKSMVDRDALSQLVAKAGERKYMKWTGVEFRR